MSSNKYRSGFEAEIGDILSPAGFEYEPMTIYYTMPGNYTPDFVLDVGGLGQILVECKGYFRPGDTKKYKAINDSLLFDELVFVLQAPHKKVRKGAKLTMAGWCEKHGIKWYDKHNLHELIARRDDE